MVVVRTTPAAVTAAFLLAVAAGCGTGTHHAAKTSASRVATRASVSASPSAVALKFGQAVTINRDGIGAWTATVTAWTRGAATQEPADQLAGTPGWRFDAAQIRVCHTTGGSDTTPDDNSVGWTSWAATANDDSVTFAEDFTGPILATTQYPTSYVLQVGKCVAGWIPFKVAAAATVTAVSYQPKDDTGTHVEAGNWTVG